MVCRSCRIGMEMHEKRVEKIGARHFLHRFLVCLCLQCRGRVDIPLTPTKAEARARRNYRRSMGRRMGKALSAAMAIHERWLEKKREGLLGPK